MSNRRYADDEVRKILDQALRPETLPVDRRGSADGLTLAEIQSIAQEVGVEPDAVSRAAARLDAAPVPTRDTALGMPVQVGVTVPLARALADHEWDALVAELRATFGATGRVSREGSIRQWSNGNLRAAIEPSGSGVRLRLSTVKGDAQAMNAMGVIGVGASMIVTGAAAMSGGVADALFGALFLGASGAAVLIANAVRLPRWANRRQRQMEHVASHAQALAAVLRVETSGR